MLNFFKLSFLVAGKNFKQLLHQKGILVLNFISPLLIFFILSLVFDGKIGKIRIVTSGESSFVKSFEKSLAETYSVADYSVKNYSSSDKMYHVLNVSDADVGVEFSKTGKAKVVLGGFRYATNQAHFGFVSKAIMSSSVKNFVSNVLAKTGSSVNGAMFKNSSFMNLNDVSKSYVHNISNFSMFETIGPGICALLIIFMTFVVAGISFLREKTTGTLNRVLISPLGVGSLIFGFLISFGVLGLGQTILFQYFYRYVFNLQINGSFGLSVLCGIFTTLSGITLGLMVSAFAKTEFEIMQIIPVFLLPQIGLSGIFKSIEPNTVLDTVSNFLPMKHSVVVFNDVMLKNASFLDIYKPLLFLLLSSLVFFAFAYFALIKYKPGKR